MRSAPHRSSSLPLTRSLLALGILLMASEAAGQDGSIVSWGSDYFEEVSDAAAEPDGSIQILTEECALLVPTDYAAHRSTTRRAVSPAALSVIDLFVVYTPAAASATADIVANIQLAIDVANRAFLNSSINAKVELVGTQEILYVPDGNFFNDLGFLQDPADGVLDEVHDLREEFGADLVTLVLESGSPSGAAPLLTNLSGDSRDGFNIVQGRSLDPMFTSHNQTLAHEIGHNLGADHSRSAEIDPEWSTLFSYAYAYIDLVAKFKTILASNAWCLPEGCTFLENFSNPAVDYLGRPTGIPQGEPDSADNALTMNYSAPLVASYFSRPAPVPEPRGVFPALVSLLTLLGLKRRRIGIR